MITDELQLHVTTDVRRLDFLKGLLPGRRVLELGAGTGALTRVILDAGAASVLAYEVQPGICALSDGRLRLVEADYTASLDMPGVDCVVAAPAYSTLDFVVERVLRGLRDAVLVVPEARLGQFTELGFSVAAYMDGASFEPTSSGTHCVVVRGFSPFVDLHRECASLAGGTQAERVARLAAKLPAAALCALGGFPFEWDGPPARFTWCGTDATGESVRRAVRRGLGLSGVLTYTNRRGRSLDELGEICAGRGETWAYHWITASVVLAGHPPGVHLAFARDGRLRLSWPLEEAFTGKVFVASGGLHEWAKVTAKADDPSFDRPTRAALAEAWAALKAVLP